MEDTTHFQRVGNKELRAIWKECRAHLHTDMSDMKDLQSIAAQKVSALSLSRWTNNNIWNDDVESGH
jgi:hypothetical protein